LSEVTASTTGVCGIRMALDWRLRSSDSMSRAEDAHRRVLGVRALLEVLDLRLELAKLVGHVARVLGLPDLVVPDLGTFGEVADHIAVPATDALALGEHALGGGLGQHLKVEVAHRRLHLVPFWSCPMSGSPVNPLDHGPDREPRGAVEVGHALGQLARRPARILRRVVALVGLQLGEAGLVRGLRLEHLEGLRDVLALSLLPADEVVSLPAEVEVRAADAVVLALDLRHRRPAIRAELAGLRGARPFPSATASGPGRRRPACGSRC